MKPARFEIVVFIIVTILFALGFYKNQWNVADPADIQFRRDVSEIYIMGRLVKSQQDGVFSAGGLLGIGDVSDYNVESRVIRNQIKKYMNGREFDQFWVYKSTPGFQGIVFSLFDQYTSLTPQMNLIVFRWAVSISLAAILALFCLWVGMEAGWLATFLVVIFIVASKWLTILGGNLYWCLGAFYLPLVVFSFLVHERGSKGTLHLSTIIIWAYFLALIKILFTGFEFITTALIMLTVPFVFYCVLDGWGWRIFFQRLASLGVAMFTAVVTGLLVLGVQVQSVLGSYAEARNYIVDAWVRRTTGDQASWINPLSVLQTYLSGYAFDLAERLELGPGLLKETLDGKYLWFILAFLIATVVFLARYATSKNSQTFRTGFALIISLWYSLLAPLSWLMVFREHATIHTQLDFVVWQMPFMFFGMALIGFLLFTWQKTESHPLHLTPAKK
jgi:hypothetical protein